MVENVLYNKSMVSGSSTKVQRELVRQYLKRNYNESDKIVFLLKTGENHIRRGAEKRGWLENKVYTSIIYDVKFETQDQ